jgi:DNA polymerase-3 subunit alpha
LFIKFRPQNFFELVIFLALNRPGVRRRAETIVKAKISKIRFNFTSPIIREILAETYGFIVFEEQMSQILSLIYDCSFSEAEVKRVELGKTPLPKNLFNEIRKKLPLAESKFVYEQITSAAGYTFNKAHAVSYGYLTYYIAYLKANFFSELIVHFLNKKKEKELSYLQEAFFYGFQIKGPDINYSEID